MPHMRRGWKPSRVLDLPMVWCRKIAQLKLWKMTTYDQILPAISFRLLGNGFHRNLGDIQKDFFGTNNIYHT